MFEKSFKLAKMFVKNSSVDLSKNKFENITLIWDMNKLFEEFVYQVIKRKIKTINNKKNKFVKDQVGKYLLESNRRLTKADIIVKTANEKIIIDTKYKKLLSFDRVSSSDLYQVGMYCVIHDEESLKPRAILLYPKYPGCKYIGEAPQEYTNTKYSVSIKSIDLMKNIKEDLKKSVTESTICQTLNTILSE